MDGANYGRMMVCSGITAGGRGRWIVARKGRARRFREARELKQGFDDGLFREGGASLADIADEDGNVAAKSAWDDEIEDRSDWDDEDPLRADERGSAAS
jgi:hypothetical protein